MHTNNYRTPILEKSGKIYLKVLIGFSIVYWLYMFYEDYTFIFINQQTDYGHLFGIWFLYFILFNIFISIGYWIIIFVFLAIYKLFKRIKK